MEAWSKYTLEAYSEKVREKKEQKNVKGKKNILGSRY